MILEITVMLLAVFSPVTELITVTMYFSTDKLQFVTVPVFPKKIAPHPQS